MNGSYYVIGVLIILLALQQYHIHVLINKLSSRSFYEYQQAQQLGKPEPVSVKQDTDIPEDLGYLGGMR